MTFDLVISGGRVLTGSGSFTGDVAVSGERIAALGTGLKGRRTIDATGKLVVPGAIDGHVHMRTERPSFCYDDDFRSASVAAAFGGTTTFIDQIQAEPGRRLVDEFDARIAAAEGESAIDFAFHMNIREADPERLHEVPEIVSRGISSFKWFMAYPGWRVPDGFLQKGMFATARHGALNIIHAENQPVIDELKHRSALAGRRDLAHFTECYPKAAEAAAIALALAMAEQADSRCLIFHNTCAEGIAAIRAAKDRGVAAFGEACLAWLLHDDGVYKGGPVEGAPYLVTPPIRDAESREALWRGLATGDLDIVSTDHAASLMRPEDEVLKVVAGFGVDLQVPPPGPATKYDAQGRRLMPLMPPGGVETRFPLLYSEGVARGRISVERWIELCCTAPADLFDLPRKGRLLPGCDADIVVFDPNATRTYATEHLHSKTDYSVWDGWRCQGQVEKVFSRGNMIVDGQSFLGAPDHGRYLARIPGGAAAN